MKLYAITLYRGNMADYYVGLVEKRPTKEELLELGHKFKLSDDEDDNDALGVAEVEILGDLSQLNSFTEINSLAYLPGHNTEEDSELEKLE